jgi:hypothetical protein
MELIIERTLSKKEFLYKIIGKDQLIGRANYTGEILLRKILVTDLISNVSYLLSQTNILIKLLNALPLLNLYSFTNFKYYVNAVYKGRTSSNFFKPQFRFLVEDIEYIIYSHKNNFVSIMRNDKQIALIKKEDVTYAEKNRYLILYEESSQNNIAFLLLLVCFIDVVFYPNHFSFSYIKYERTVGFDKNYDDRVNWEPM